MSLLIHCPSRYTAGGIHIESYFVLVSSCNHSVVNKQKCDDHHSQSIVPNKKRERPNKKRKAQKREKKRNKKGQCYYPFSTLVLQSSTMIFMIESLLYCHFHILVGIFHYRTWLVYSDDGLPQMPEVFMSKQVGCTPTQFSV